MFFFSTLVVRIITKSVIVKHFGINNTFTNVVLFDIKEPDNKQPDKKVDWAALYPFSTEKTNEEKNANDSIFESKINKLKSKIEDSTIYNLIFYYKIIELSNAYKSAIKWNYATYSEYNMVISTDDGYLTSVSPLVDNSKTANATVSFANFCKENNTPFLYVNAPFKVCEYCDTDISGVYDFTNQNADSFINKLEECNVDYCDLRKKLHEEGLNHHSLFFRTDHHWKPESGLWAARIIAGVLNSDYGFKFDVSLIEDDKFTYVLYPDWFLGSQGKKVTLSVVEPDDISLLYPIYPTKLHFELKNKGISTDGEFSILYNMESIDECNYYHNNPYAAYSYGDQALERIENTLLNNGNHLLIIHDSFGDCVIPFLALGCQYIDAIDLRHFDGSLQSFILKEKPDVVVILYNGSITNNSTVENGGLYDFR